MKRSVMFALVLVAVLAAECLSASYSFKQLDLQGGNGGHGINNGGQVVGWSGDMGPAVLYSRGTKSIVAAEGSALDINENGQIVGWLWNDGKFPFLYSGGTLNVLGLPGTTIFDGEARAINNNGDVVGWGTVPDTTNAFIFGAFRYSGGEIQLLDANGVANDINDNGQIVGNFTNGFLYSNGVSSNPGTLPGALWYEGLSINEAGDIAGRAMFPNGSHAFAYIAGAMLDLGPGEATGINELGQVVGNFSGGFFGFRPFLFSSGALYDLEEVIGYPLHWAAAINDSGQITGEAGSGDTIAFLLTPVPEPSSVMLAAIGLVGLAAWGWRRRV